MIVVNDSSNFVRPCRWCKKPQPLDMFNRNIRICESCFDTWAWSLRANTKSYEHACLSCGDIKHRRKFKRKRGNCNGLEDNCRDCQKQEVQK